MNEKIISYTIKLTHVATALANELEKDEVPVYSDYSLFLKLKDIYKHPEGLYLKQKKLTLAAYRRTRKLLIDAQIIKRDPNYSSAYRVLSMPDLPADDIVCLIDPFCYISHLSAMQTYGLTDRRPEALHVTIPAVSVLKELIHQKMICDYGEELNMLPKEEIHPLQKTHHRPTVRKRKIEIFSTKHYGDNLRVKGTYKRISSIGQTFLDMLENPQLCGGMAHVLDVWKQHAHNYLEDIINAVENAPKPIHKVRAGYILDEILNIENPKVKSWIKFAQRGGSRVLDPSKPFTPNFSEKWMISINV